MFIKYNKNRLEYKWEIWLEHPNKKSILGYQKEFYSEARNLFNRFKHGRTILTERQAYEAMEQVM